MSLTLNPVEIRVLAVLMEKALSQPAYYPMTLNAVAAACNQKSNRDPVMRLDNGEVGAALHALRQWQLVDQAEPDHGSRANRFRHKVEERFGWNAAQRAVMAELMLRGPQTVGEIRGRASRMTRLEAVDYVREVLQDLMDADPPMVLELPRRPGRSANRFAQLLGGEAPEQAATAATVEMPTQALPVKPPDHSLTQRVDRLEEEVESLRTQIAAMQSDRRHE